MGQMPVLQRWRGAVDGLMVVGEVIPPVAPWISGITPEKRGVPMFRGCNLSGTTQEVAQLKKQATHTHTQC